MIQPGIAKSVFGNELLKDQGFLSRLLIAAPPSRIGARLIEEGEEASARRDAAEAELLTFHRRVKTLLDLPVETGSSPLELRLPTLKLQPEARQLLVTFANLVEQEQASGGSLSAITGFASKAAEQAARIAGVLTILEDETRLHIDAKTMHDALQLTEWYLTEAQRALDAGHIDPKIQQAQVMLDWLKEKRAHVPFDNRSLVRLGPSALRDTPTVASVLSTLEQYNWLRPCEGAIIDGRQVAKAWTLASDA